MLPTERRGAGVQIPHSLLGRPLCFSHNDALGFTAVGHGEFLTLSLSSPPVPRESVREGMFLSLFLQWQGAAAQIPRLRRTSPTTLPPEEGRILGPSLLSPREPSALH